VDEDSVTRWVRPASTAATRWRPYTFSAGLDEIPEYAFAGCFSLQEIDLPEGVVAIYTNAFNGDLSVTVARLPASLGLVDNYAFDGCTALSDVYFAGTMSQWGFIEFNTGIGNDPLFMPVFTAFGAGDVR
jgi:hypothetical protein